MKKLLLLVLAVLAISGIKAEKRSENYMTEQGWKHFDKCNIIQGDLIIHDGTYVGTLHPKDLDLPFDVYVRVDESGKYEPGKSKLHAFDADYFLKYAEHINNE